jgi:hypothetical protein
MFLYKGSAIGTHWHRNDARLAGFTTAAWNVGPAYAVNHITAHSAPSGYISFTTSFAVAAGYALSGGFVYVIDTALLPLQCQVVDPAAEIVAMVHQNGSQPWHRTFPRLPWHHTGDATLLSAIAKNDLVAQSTPAAQPPPSAPMPPIVQPELRAVTFALRDSEVLLAGNIPSSCIVHAYVLP